MANKRKWICWLGWVLAALPAVAPLWLIIQDGVDFHFWDEWDPGLAGLYIKAHQHQLTFTDLISQHNEHRLLIPRLIYFAINFFTDWNNLANLWTGWIFACVASAAILRLIRQTAASGRICFLWFLGNVLIFTPAQSENWLWGIGVANLLPMTLFAVTIAVAASALRPWLKCFLCLLLASAATFTNGNGFFFWGLVGALLIWSPSIDELRKKKWLFTAWIAGFAANAAVYFYHYQKPGYVGGYYTLHPLRVLSYLLTFCGNEFAYSTTYPWQAACAVLGGIMLVLYLAAVVYFFSCWRRGKIQRCGILLIWLAVGGFSVLSALVASFCRAGYGPQQAISSRYVTHSLFLPVALISLIPLIFDDLRTRLADRVRPLWFQIPVGLATALIFIQICTFPAAVGGCQGWRIFQRQLKAALLLVNILPDNPQLALVFPTPSILRKQANALNDMGYLHPPLIAGNNAADIRAADSNPAGARGQLQTVTGPQPGYITASGWAIFTHPAQAADAVFLTYQDAQNRSIIFAVADIGMKRDDIARQLNDSRYDHCGWQATFPVTLLPADAKTIRIAAWSLDADDGKAFSLEGAITLQH